MEKNLSKSFDRIITTLIDSINELVICNATTLSSKGWSFKEGCFNEFEICFLIAGSTSIQCGEARAIVKAGEVFALDNSLTIECRDGNFTYLTFVFTMECQKKYELLKGVFSEITGRHTGFNSKMLESIYKNMISEYLARKPHYELSLKLLLIQVLVEISRPYKAISGGTVNYSKYSRLAWEIAEYISTNLDSKISLSELGEKYKLNPRYLNRVFKSVTGLPVISFQQNLKVDAAKKMLMSNSKTISSISNELNFPTSQYFSHIFKKVTGRTPGEYRKRPY